MSWIEALNAKQDSGTIQPFQPPQNSSGLIQSPKKRQGPGGIRGVLTSLLPLAGGALGALGGSAIAPVAGTVAGGAAGSAAGEALREKIMGGGLHPTDIAVQGAFGAIPGVGKGISALRAGEGAGALIRGAQAAKTAEAGAGVTQVATRPGLGQRLYNKGVITEARAGGFGQGEKVAGGDLMGFRQTEDVTKTLANEKIPGASASTRQIAVGDKLQNYADQINQAVQANNPKVLASQKSGILGRIQDRIVGGPNGQGIPGFVVGDNANSKFAMSLANQFSGIKDAKGLLNFKRALDEQAINYGRNSAAPDPIKEQIARAFRQEVNADFGEMVPAAKKASDSYAKLHDANEFLKQAARDASNSATQSGGGLFSRAATSDTAEAARSKAGRGMQSLGKLMGGKEGRVPTEPLPTATPSSPSTMSNILSALTSPKQVSGAAVKQAIPRALTGVPITPGLRQQDQSAQPAPDLGQLGLSETPGLAPGATDVTGGMLSGGMGLSSQAASPYPETSLMRDISRDPKNTSTYLTLYKELNPSQSQSTAGQVKPTAQQVSNAQSGMASLQRMADLIQTDPSLVGRSAIPGQGLPVVGGLARKAAGTGEYQALATNVMDALARAKTGAAMTNEEKNMYRQFLPQPGDTPQAIRAKLAQFQTAFQSLEFPQATLDQAGAYGQ